MTNLNVAFVTHAWLIKRKEKKTASKFYIILVDLISESPCVSMYRLPSPEESQPVTKLKRMRG